MLSHKITAAALTLLLVMASLSWTTVDSTPRLDIRVELDDLWVQYKKTHSKVYDDDIEESYRRLVWERNLDYIQKHNAEADIGLHSYTLGVNQFADLTVEEYRNTMLGTKVQFPLDTKKITLLDDSFFDYVPAPDTVDWTKNGSVSPVQNQGPCGSCWAFAAIGALESQWYKKTGKLVKLSEQNLVDCSRPFYNYGCGGGWMNNAYDYIINNTGVDTAESYPYEARDGPCRFKPSSVGATCKGYISPSRNEKSLKQAVFAVGPIAVAIDASRSSFQYYRSGVYNDPNCTLSVNHAVLIVGYGTFEEQDYWLVKNSWGTSWGESGYIKMARNKDNQCSIASYPTFPLV